MKLNKLIAAGAAALALTTIGGGTASAAFNSNAPAQNTAVASQAVSTKDGKVQLVNYPREGEINKWGGKCYITTRSGGNGGPRFGYREIPCPPGM